LIDSFNFLLTRLKNKHIYIRTIIKKKFTDNKINSNDINIIIIFFRFKKIPKTPIQNIKKETLKKKKKSKLKKLIFKNFLLT